MPRTTRDLLPFEFSVVAASKEPLHAQIREQLRMAILERRIAPGRRLPSSRLLAEHLRCARGTVLLALEQMAAEGYVHTVPGGGTYVADDLPEDLLTARPTRGRVMATLGPTSTTHVSRRAQAWLERPGQQPETPRAAASPGPTRMGGAFVLGRPALDAFPFRLWARLLEAEWRDPPDSGADPRHPFGDDRLRDAIGAYLGSARGFAADPASIVITSGVRQSLTLLAHMLVDPGDLVLVEEPGYRGVVDALATTGACPVGIPVDDQGFDIALAQAAGPSARLAVVTPAHQYPLGMTMSLSRRLALLQWAEARDAWIVEDDYDGEYRYAGRPLAPLRALDRSDRVAYVGSFSKILFPSLRLGYLVLPKALVPVGEAVLAASGPSTSNLGQAALARFISEGHFAAHLRRTRRIYADRQAVLVDEAGRTLSGILDVPADPAGMHLMAWPATGSAGQFDDEDATRRAAVAGITVAPLSRNHATIPANGGHGLLLGYAALAPATIRLAVSRLARALA